MTNVKRSYRNGLEITAGLKPLSFVEWKMNLALSSNKISDFTEYYVDYDTATGESEYKSKYIGKVDIAYSPSITGTSDIGVGISPAVEFHLISKYVGRQYFDNTMSSERMLKPYFISNLMLSYEPAVNKIKQIRVQLFVNNILNSMYASNAYGGNLYESGEEKSWAYYFPQAGINFMVRAAVTF
jgi:iron complex outermembrane receptor protein